MNPMLTISNEQSRTVAQKCTQHDILIAFFGVRILLFVILAAFTRSGDAV